MQYIRKLKMSQTYPYGSINKISAIKSLRSVSNLSLKEAKDIVDAAELKPHVFMYTFNAEDGMANKVLTEVVNTCGAAGYPIQVLDVDVDNEINKYLKQALMLAINSDNYSMARSIINLLSP